MGGCLPLYIFQDQYLTGPYRQITDAIVITKLSTAPVRIQLQGRELFLATDPILRNEHILVPVGEVLPDMNITVNYNPEDSSVTAQKGDVILRLKLDNCSAQVNGADRPLDVPATLYNNQVYIPIRLIAEVFNFSIEWLPESNLVSLL